MATAKGIGGGFPLGACLATERGAGGMGLGTHGSTYGGNPLAMAAGMAVLDAVLEPGFPGRTSATMGERLRATLEQFIGNHPDLFDHVRGTGLMLGLRLKTESRPFVAHLRDEHQLLTVAAAGQCGPHPAAADHRAGGDRRGSMDPSCPPARRAGRAGGASAA